MAEAHEVRETLPQTIELDPSSGLPLRHQLRAVHALVLAYLALPYSVAEHGCGKKTSLVIHELIRLGIPPHALRRGMILEPDLSPGALAMMDPTRRVQPLQIDNPLHSRADLSDPRLRRFLTARGFEVEGEELIRAGPFDLRNDARVQFAIARSHIVPLVTFWDDESGRAVERVVDPTLRRDDLIEIDALRALTGSDEALLLAAPLCGRFRIVPEWLTAAQARTLLTAGFDAEALDAAAATDHAALVRTLTRAEPGSLGDPATWTYANNVSSRKLSGTPAGADHDARQRADTGRGDELAGARRRLIESRTAPGHGASEVDSARREAERRADEADIATIASRDADWCERELEPLADLAIAVGAFNALDELASAQHAGQPLAAFLQDDGAHRPLRGIGVRQRRRIDRMAIASTEPDGEIDGRALRRGFVQCAIETIREMNDAGLEVFVDRVGNIHGVALAPAELDRIRSGATQLATLTRSAIIFASHIDTVADAGKFDGRLGVSAGIEIAAVLADLRAHFDVDLVPDAPRIVVTAYNGEEMTFTGRKVSMPGSAAIAGRATVEDVHAMTDARGDEFGHRLREMLATIGEEQAAGSIRLVTELVDASQQDVIAACADPIWFFSPHTFERHIEQGPVLDRAEVPLALVDTIMGIHQSDFAITGAAAEAAALEFAVRVRELALEDRFQDSRATVGIIERGQDTQRHETPVAALLCVLEGEQNHAGATLTADRGDPGVAAGRLVRRARDWFAEHGDDGQQLVVGDVELEPGNARNVIPGRARCTLGILDGELEPAERNDLLQSLRGAASGDLTRRVARGGEGLRRGDITEVSFVDVATAVRVSLDLRNQDSTTMAAAAAAVTEVCDDLENRHDVRIERSIEQEVAPMPIEETGQVLLIERSYGGSHNPNETQLMMDVTRGCIVQLATLAALAERTRGQGLDDGLNLVEVVNDVIPDRWQARLRRFVSGALHDTCNIAARVAADRGRDT